MACKPMYVFRPCDQDKETRKPHPDFTGLLMREFFYTASSNNPYFDKMKGNPMCVQIPWDRNPEAMAKWAEGRTGFPWIDAIMAQLKKEGWISQHARRAVVCFLTRGDLWLSWEEGLKVSVKHHPPAPPPHTSCGGSAMAH